MKLYRKPRLLIDSKETLGVLLAKAFVVTWLSFLFGCDSVCEPTVREVIHVQNSTGQNLNLEVCTSALSEKEMIEVPIGVNGKYLIRERKVFYLAHGRESCDIKDGDEFEIEISLPSSSFAKVKLCYQAEEVKLKNFILLEKDNNCPVGYIAQLEPNDECKFQSLEMVLSK